MNINILKSTDDKPIVHLFHLSDIHIRNYKRHIEYDFVFQNFISYLKNFKTLKHTGILITGDIVHSKTEISPELVVFTTKFINNIASILPVFIIAGNHDMNTNNPQRLDTISAILDDIENKHNIYYMKSHGLHNYNNINFVVSDFRENNIIPFSDVLSIIDSNTSLIEQHAKFPNTYNIALYHGLISQTYSYTHMITSSIKLSDFEGYDGAMLGDNHKHQFLKSHIAYAGSMIQQNFGEHINNHGFIHWILKYKTHELVGKHITLQNDYGFRTIHVVNDDLLIDKCDDLNTFPKNVHLRVICKNSTKTEINNIVHQLSKDKNFTICSLSFKDNNFIGSSNSEFEKTLVDIVSLDNINNVLIPEFLKDSKLSSDDMKSIIELNSECFGKLKEKGDVDNLHEAPKYWKILTLEFENLFCYEHGNVVNFENGKLNGIIGIIGENTVGKSALVDIILFALFDKPSRGTINDIINVRCKNYSVTLKISVNNELYIIKRFGKIKSHNVSFKKINKDGSDVLLHDSNKRLTNESIRKLIGSFDDFINTNVCLQNEINKIITMKQTERKQFLSKIMKLDILDKLWLFIKKNVTENKILLNQLYIDVEKHDLEQLEHELSTTSSSITETRKFIDFLENSLEIMIEKQNELKNSDPSNSSSNLPSFEEMDKLQTELYNLKKRETILQSNIDKHIHLREKKQYISKRRNQIKNLENDIVDMRKTIKPIGNRDLCSNMNETDIENEIEKLEDTQEKLSNDIKKNDSIIAEKQLILNELNKLEIIEDIDENKTILIKKLEKLSFDLEYLNDILSIDYDVHCDKCMSNPFVKKHITLTNDGKSSDTLNIIRKERSITFEKLSQLDQMKKQQSQISTMEHEIYTIRISNINLQKKLDQIIERLCDLKNTKSNSVLLTNLKSNEKLIKQRQREINMFQDRLSQLEKFENQHNIVSNNISILQKTFDEKKNLFQIFSSEENIKLHEKIDKLSKEITVTRVGIKEKNEHLTTLLLHENDLRKSIAEYHEKKIEIIKRERMKNIYKIYKKITSADGLQLSIVKNQITNINDKINEYLHNIIDFCFKLELINDKNITISLIRGNEKYSIEQGSGYEKFIAGLVIKQSLVDISCLSKTNIFIIDEGFGNLDSDNLASISNIFGYLRSCFDKTFIISHIEQLKDDIDVFVNIKKNSNGFSKIYEI